MCRPLEWKCIAEMLCSNKRSWGAGGSALARCRHDTVKLTSSHVHAMEPPEKARVDQDYDSEGAAATKSVRGIA
jgi:hypothetical protein